MNDQKFFFFIIILIDFVEHHDHIFFTIVCNVFFNLHFKVSSFDSDSVDVSIRRENGISNNSRISESQRQPQRSLSLLRKQLDGKNNSRISENGNTNEIFITNQTASDEIFQAPLKVQSQSTTLLPSSVPLCHSMLNMKADPIIPQQKRDPIISQQKRDPVMSLQQQQQNQSQGPSINDKARLNLFSAIKSLRKDS